MSTISRTPLAKLLTITLAENSIPLPPLPSFLSSFLPSSATSTSPTSATSTATDSPFAPKSDSAEAGVGAGGRGRVRLGPIVPPGTHHYEKFVKPEELVAFFRDDLGWATPSFSPSSRPSTSSSSSTPPPPEGTNSRDGSSAKAEERVDGADRVVERSAIETRGVVYEPWRGGWRMMSRGAKWGELCNYYFGARKPL